MDREKGEIGNSETGERIKGNRERVEQGNRFALPLTPIPLFSPSPVRSAETSKHLVSYAHC